MLGFSKKRFFVTLGLSMLVWGISLVIQQLFSTDNIKYSFFIFAKSCEVTGYPLALCIPDYNRVQIFLTYLLNLTFWFWIIHLFWGWFEKGKD